MTMPTVDRARFRAMGCDAEIEIRGGAPDALQRAQAMVVNLEQRWSRFLDTSDITRLNVAEGADVVVDVSTITLIESLIAGFVATTGRFDPTLLAPLIALGYHASHTDQRHAVLLEPRPLEPCDVEAIAIDHERSSVRLPRGTMLDPGGLGKGLAADLVAEDALRHGAQGVMVSIGGDLRVGGIGAHQRSWQIDVASPVTGARPIGCLVLAEGGIATSGVVRRSWTHTTLGHVHHLLDPATRMPLAHGGFVQATVLAGTAAWAEAYTKAVMISGPIALDELDAGDLPVCAVRFDGEVVVNRSWERFSLDRKEIS